MNLRPETWADLQEQRKRLAAEIEAIDRILAAYPAPKAAEGSKGTESRNGTGDLATKGLRDSIQAVLGKVSSGLKPTQVAQVMTLAGYQDDDERATPLQTRVGNEMWRLANEGVLRKDKRGVYKLAKSGKASSKTVLSPVPTSYEDEAEETAEEQAAENENGAPASR